MRWDYISQCSSNRMHNNNIKKGPTGSSIWAGPIQYWLYCIPLECNCNMDNLFLLLLQSWKGIALFFFCRIAVILFLFLYISMVVWVTIMWPGKVQKISNVIKANALYITILRPLFILTLKVKLNKVGKGTINYL